MKKLIVCLAAVAMVSTTVGCANGPIRSFLRNTLCNPGCQAPPVDPAHGFGYSETAAPGGCNCGQVGTSYMNDSFSQGDPYMNGSNYDGATINAPLFDSYGGSSFGSTIVPPDSSGVLPPQGNGG